MATAPPPDAAPVLEVVSGRPTDEELAAVSVVLLALARAPRHVTAAPARRLRWDGWTPAGTSARPARDGASPGRHRTMWL